VVGTARALRVLLIEPDRAHAERLADMLRRPEPQPFEVAAEASLARGLDRLARDEFDVVLLGLSVPDAGDVDALQRVRAQSRRPVVAMGPNGGGDLGARLVGAGADDYLVRDRIDGPLVRRALQHAVDRQRTRRDLLALVQVGHELAATTDGTLVAQRIVETTRTVLGVRAAAVYWPDEESGDLVAMAAAGFGSAGGDGVLPAGTAVAALAMEAAGAVHSANVLEDARLTLAREARHQLADSRLRSVLALPLVVHDVVIGALTLVDVTGRVFSPEEQRLARALADHAALAVERTRLHDQNERRRREAEALTELARSLAEHVDLDDVGRRIVERAAAFFGVRFARLRLLQPEGSLRALAWTGPIPDYAESWNPLPPGVGVAGRAVAEGKPVWSADVLSDPEVVVDDAVRGVFGLTTDRAILGVPLRTRGRIIGSLTLGDRMGRTFSPTDITLLQAFADQAAVALETARLYGDMQHQLRHTQTLLDVAQDIGAALDLTETMRRVARHLARALAADTVGAYIAAGDVLTPLTGYHVPKRIRDVARDFPVAIRGHALVEEAWRTRGAVWSGDAPGDPRVDRATFAHFPFRSVIAVPMVVKNELIGVLFAVWWEASRQVSDAELKLAEGISRQAALAIEDATLYQEAEERRREAEVLAELTRTIGASLDLDTVLQRVADGALRLCRAGGSTIALSEPSGTAVIRYTSGQEAGLLGMRVEPGKGAGGLVLRTRRPFRTDDYLADPRITADYHARVRARGARALLVVPIIGDGGLDGLLYIQHRSVRRFSDRDESNLVTLADKAAAAIRNARIFAREQSARSEAEAAARALRESQQALLVRERALEASSEGIVIIDPSQPGSPIIYANPAFLAQSGYTEDEVRGRNYWFLQGPGTDPGVIAALRTAITERRPFRGEILDYRKDGTPFWCELSVAPILDPSGEVTHFVGLQSDITERKQAAERLSLTQDQLRQAQKMEAVGQLAGGVAHDFNNLLTVIAGRAQLLLSSLSAGDRLARHAEIIAKTADRGSRLTQQLLAFSRKQVLQGIELNLNEVVTEVTVMLRRLIGEQIELTLAPAPDLGWVLADRFQIEQAIMNLAVNARDAMPGGGRLIIETANVDVGPLHTARFPDLRPGPYVMLAVTDTGCGIPAEIQSRIFEPFFTTKTAEKGTGLGLSMVYGVVKQSGGDILVYSDTGRGATFKVYLPRVAEPQAAPRPGAAYAPTGGTETILLVEDEPEVRSLVREILAGFGYSVVDAGLPDQALFIGERRSGPIHLLVTDVVMPQMSGRELAEQLRRIRPEVRVLYMSGYTDQAIVIQGVLEPGMEFIQKPFTPEALAAKVRATLDA
jgi:PAS domain S-box-containing protein